MNLVKVTVELEGAAPEVVEVDLDFESLTMRESVRLEEILGGDTFDELAAGGARLARPSVIRALLYAKLKTQYPTLELDAFDLDLEELTTAMADVVPLPKAGSSSSA